MCLEGLVSEKKKKEEKKENLIRSSLCPFAATVNAGNVSCAVSF